MTIFDEEIMKSSPEVTMPPCCDGATDAGNCENYSSPINSLKHITSVATGRRQSTQEVLTDPESNLIPLNRTPSDTLFVSKAACSRNENFISHTIGASLIDKRFDALLESIGKIDASLENESSEYASACRDELSPIPKSDEAGLNSLTVGFNSTPEFKLPFMFETSSTNIAENGPLMGTYVIEEQEPDQSTDVEVITNQEQQTHSVGQHVLESRHAEINAVRESDLPLHDNISRSRICNLHTNDISTEITEKSLNCRFTSTSELLHADESLDCGIVSEKESTKGADVLGRVTDFCFVQEGDNEPEVNTRDLLSNRIDQNVFSLSLKRNMSLIRNLDLVRTLSKDITDQSRLKSETEDDPSEIVRGLDSSKTPSSLDYQLLSDVDPSNIDDSPDQTFISKTTLLKDDDVLRAKKEIGASSKVFIQKLRGAAFKRKMNLTRSRDFLAAKEKLHREAIAASKAARLQTDACKTCTAVAFNIDLTNGEVSNAKFQARPMPATTGVRGIGGLSGVPKVEKKPPTVPCSPLLGTRRGRLEISSTGSIGTSSKSSASLMIIRGGATGIPKVKKRPTTVPMSPLLGKQRDCRNIYHPDDFKATHISSISSEYKKTQQTLHRLPTRQFPQVGQIGVPRVTKRPVTIPKSPMLGNRRLLDQRLSTLPSSVCEIAGDSTQRLHGLRLLRDTSKENISDSNSRMFSFLNVGSTLLTAIRAQKREAFEKLRFTNEQFRMEEQRRLRLSKVIELEKQLDQLKSKI